MRTHFEYLNALLNADEKLRGYVGYPNLKRALADELIAVEASIQLAKDPVASIEEPVAAPIFPPDSGVVQKETESVVQSSDRRF